MRNHYTSKELVDHDDSIPPEITKLLRPIVSFESCHGYTVKLAPPTMLWHIDDRQYNMIVPSTTPTEQRNHVFMVGDTFYYDLLTFMDSVRTLKSIHLQKDIDTYHIMRHVALALKRARREVEDMINLLYNWTVM